MLLQKNFLLISCLFWAGSSLQGAPVYADMTLDSFFEKYEGTIWQGSSDLWVDPSGNTGASSVAELSVEDGKITYLWSLNKDKHFGTILQDPSGIRWQDSFHTKEQALLTFSENVNGIFAATYMYSEPENPGWFWRIKMSQRPDKRLVVQMTNITPWGEEARAVRLILQLKAAPEN